MNKYDLGIMTAITICCCCIIWHDKDGLESLAYVFISFICLIWVLGMALGITGLI